MEHAVYERGWAGGAGARSHSGAEVAGRSVASAEPYLLAHVVPPTATTALLPRPDPAGGLARRPPPRRGLPAAVRAGRVVYLSFPLCRAYRRHGSRVYRTLVRNAIDLLLPQRLVTAGLPSYGQVTVLRQPRDARPAGGTPPGLPRGRRTAQLDMIEDVVPLRDVPLSLRPGFRPSRVYEAPSETPLPFSWEGARRA